MLKERWTELMDRLSLPDNIDTLEELVTAYTLPDRHYHTLDHISAMLEVLDARKGMCDSPDLVELAIWFHDVVYEIDSDSNEYHSAQEALNFMMINKMSLDNKLDVNNLIMATTHKNPYPSQDSRLIADIDLHQLGAPWEVYHQNSLNIREEYRYVRDEVFYPERAKLFQNFLDRPKIYKTKTFQVLYEKQAQANIEKMLGLDYVGGRL